MVFSLQTAHTFIFHSHFSFVDWFQSFLTRIQIIAYINLCQVGYFWVPKTTEHRKRRSSRSNGSTFPIHHLQTQSRTIVWLVEPSELVTGSNEKSRSSGWWFPPFPWILKPHHMGSHERHAVWSGEASSRPQEVVQMEWGAKSQLWRYRMGKKSSGLSSSIKAYQWFIIISRIFGI